MGKPIIAELSTNAAHAREREVGILRWVNEANLGFEGVLKQRYTDFLVNEITPEGKVVHLTTLGAPKKPQQAQAAVPQQQESVQKAEIVAPVPAVAPEADNATTPVAQASAEVAKPVDEKEKETPASEAKDDFILSTEDEALLDNYFGADVRDQIVKMYKRILAKPNEKAATYGSVTSEPILDRALRTQLHQDMRRIFSSKLETSTDKDGYIKIFAAPRSKPAGPRGAMYQQQTPRNQQKGKLGWAELGGEHLHFSLFKENKDTMEVISYVAGRLGMKPRSFAFAGTKDRRGVTVQRVSVFRKNADQIAYLNKDMWGSRVGDFTYEKHGLELGDLTGNEFLITLRDCQFPGGENLNDAGKIELANTVVGGAVKSLQNHGFLNYYGLQRFGTYLIGTDEIGKLILKGDFKGAVDAILSYSPECLAAGSDPNFVTSDGKPLSRDDIARAEAIHLFEGTGRAKDALDKLPRKFSAESAIMRHLDRVERKADYVSAILQINRNLRLMYVHAYQSLVWNHALSERWAKYGSRVVAGDLVLIDKDAAKPSVDELDQNGEIVVLPAADDTAVRSEDMFQRARPLSAAEAASGAFTIFDVVLPTPGYDVEYPANEIGEFYKSFMASERGGELDPANMRRAQKDFSLSGSYRKIMGTVGQDVTYEVRAYKEDNEQMVETDLDKILKAKGEARKPFVAKTNGKDAQTTEGVADVAAAAPAPVTGEKRGAEELAAAPQEEKRTKIAVIVKFQLGSSQYATMALRELMKEGGVVTYKPDFSSGR